MKQLAEMSDRFSKVMKIRLAAKYVTKGDSYQQMKPHELMKLLDAKLSKLDESIKSNQPPKDVGLLSADIANYAMLVASRYYVSKL